MSYYQGHVTLNGYVKLVLVDKWHIFKYFHPLCVKTMEKLKLFSRKKGAENWGQDRSPIKRFLMFALLFRAQLWCNKARAKGTKTQKTEAFLPWFLAFYSESLFILWPKNILGLSTRLSWRLLLFYKDVNSDPFFFFSTEDSLEKKSNHFL